MTLVRVALGLIFLAEVVWFFWLQSWRDNLSDVERRVTNAKRTCYVCLTEASVLSFSRQSATTFCPEHRAHYHLLRDLENKTWL